MALNKDTLELLAGKIYNADSHSFSSSINMLYNYFKDEIKNNSVYDFYENEFAKDTIFEEWKTFWKSKHLGSWVLFDDLEKTKIFSYCIYKSSGVNNDNGNGNSFNLFMESRFDDNIRKFNETFYRYFEQVLNEILRANPDIETSNLEKVVGNTVFVIHGHDESLKNEVKLLLINAGVNHIVLHEQPDKGRTIIDKLLEESTASNYAIALFSPDDKTEQGEKRARQNVVLEVGYFLGKLGKERVRLLVKDKIEIPSDLQGILYEPFDTSGSWKTRILKELMAVGIYVDLQNAINKI
jgi:predicted nucleotide-binding protein